jgi:hypothetical protein
MEQTLTVYVPPNAWNLVIKNCLSTIASESAECIAESLRRCRDFEVLLELSPESDLFRAFDMLADAHQENVSSFYVMAFSTASAATVSPPPPPPPQGLVEKISSDSVDEESYIVYKEKVQTLSGKKTFLVHFDTHEQKTVLDVKISRYMDPLSSLGKRNRGDKSETISEASQDLHDWWDNEGRCHTQQEPDFF